MYKYPRTLQEAARILDAAASDWYNRVWLYKFLSNRDEDEVTDLIGQLYGSYLEGYAALFGGEPTDEQKLDNIFGQNIDYMTWEILILDRVRAEAREMLRQELQAK